jgi:hypothetical protein
MNVMKNFAASSKYSSLANSEEFNCCNMFQALKASCCFMCSNSQESNCCNLWVQASETFDAVCVQALKDPIVASYVQTLKNSIVAVCAQALKIQGCKFAACLDNSMFVYWT